MYAHESNTPGTHGEVHRMANNPNVPDYREAENGKYFEHGAGGVVYLKNRGGYYEIMMSITDLNLNKPMPHVAVHASGHLQRAAGVVLYFRGAPSVVIREAYKEAARKYRIEMGS